MAESHDLGASAEEFAVEFLRAKGFCILDRNWTFGHLELDIVCTDGKLLVIVEVKSRKQDYFPHPEDILSAKKEKFILEASEQYLYKHKVCMPVRFDLMSVIQRGTIFEIEHFQDAIIPGVE